MKVATWNIYWFGDRDGKIARTEEDELAIAEVIKTISPDVLALEEIVDPVAMERVLGIASGAGRDYAIRSDAGLWYTSDPNPVDETKNLQSLFFA